MNILVNNASIVYLTFSVVSALWLCQAGAQEDHKASVTEWLASLEAELVDGTEQEIENAKILRSWVQKVDSALDAGDLEFAHAMLELRTRGGFRHPQQQTVGFLLSRRSNEMAEAKARGQVDLINRFYEGVPAKVKAAESSDVLEPLILEADRINRDTLRLGKLSPQGIDRRFGEKLNSAKTFVHDFAEFLDKRKSGDDRGANSALQRALSSPLGVETFTRKEALNLKMKNDLGISKILDGIDSIDQAGLLSERFKKWERESPPIETHLDDDLPELIEGVKRIAALKRAGQLEAALSLAGDLPTRGMYHFPALQRVLAETIEQMLELKTREIAGLDRNESEEILAYVFRSITAEINGGRLETAYRIGSILSESRYQEGVPSWFYSELSALRNFMVGKRFSAVGDGPQAVKYLRIALEKTRGHWFSTDVVSSELSKWKKTDPELFEQWVEEDNDSLRRELEKLKSEMEIQKAEVSSIKGRLPRISR